MNAYVDVDAHNHTHVIDRHSQSLSQRDRGRGFAVVAVLLLVALVWPGQARAQAETPEMQQAAAHHNRGIELFRAGSHREAAAEFERAESIFHSRANLINLARCYQELGENRRALGYIDRYLQEPDLPPASRTRAEGIRTELQAAGDGGSGLGGPWAILGSGLALLVTGVILDIAVLSRSNTERDANDPFETYEDYDDWRQGSINLGIAGDVLVGVGAAAAVGGLIWLLVARRNNSARAARTRSLSLSPLGGRGVFLQTELRF